MDRVASSVKASTGLGETLRLARLHLGLSLHEVEQATKIRQRYVAALEAERFGELPPPVYTVGFVRTYAQYLGLDAEELARQYARLVARPEPVGVQPALSGVRLQNALNSGSVAAVAGALVLVLLAMYTYWQYQRFVETLRATPTVQLDPRQFQQPGIPPPLGTVTPGAGGTEPAPTPPVLVSVEVRPSGRVWLRVLVDDQIAFEGYLSERRLWQGKDRVFIRAGDAGAIEIIHNDRPQGRFGAPNEVKEGIWTR